MTFNELRDKLFSNYEIGAISDEQMVQIIELATSYLNLQTLTNYSKTENISYNGAKKRNNKVVKIDNVEFIINNENIVNSFNLVVPFSNFNDIENDYEIYEFGWENFNLFINSVDFNSLIENEKKQRYIKKLQEQN